MKLLIVTVVEEYGKEILQLFKKANIESFSGSDIDGYKNQATVLMASNWFPSENPTCFSPLPLMKILKFYSDLLHRSILIWKPTIP
jgi:hypothetical protein